MPREQGRYLVMEPVGSNQAAIKEAAFVEISRSRKYGRAGASQQRSSWRLGYPCSSAAERPLAYRLSSE